MQQVHECRDYQGCATMNYTDAEIPHTRIMEWRHFWHTRADFTITTTEYPMAEGDPYYPVETPENRDLYQRYAGRLNGKVIAAGRLGEYRYYNMDQAIGAAMALTEKLCKRS